MVSSTTDLKKIIHFVMQRSEGRLDGSKNVIENGLIVGKAIQTVSLLDKDVIKELCRVLQLIDSLVDRQDVIEEGWWKGIAGRGLVRSNMLGKVKGYKLLLFGHILNEFPDSSGCLKELNIV